MTFFFNLQYVLTFLGMMGSLLLGVIVLFKDRSKWQNVSFFGLTTGLFFWSLFMFVHNFTGELIWGRLIFLPVPLVIFSIWIFSFHFPVTQKKLFDKTWKYTVLILGLPSLTFIGISKYVLRDVNLIDGVLSPVKGSLMNYYYAFFLVMIIFSVSNLVRKYFISIKEEQLKMQYLTLGLVGTIAFLILFLVILPELLGTYKQAFYAPAFSIILVGFTAYSIIRRRLWSLQYIISEFVLYLLIAIFGVGVFRIAMLIHDSYLRGMNIFVRLMIELLMALSLGPIFLFLVEKSKRFLSEKISSRKWNSALVLERLNGVTEREVKLEKLVGLTFPYLKENLQVENIEIILWDKSVKKVVYSSSKPHDFSVDSKDDVELLSDFWGFLNNKTKGENVLSSSDVLLLAEDRMKKYEKVLKVIDDNSYSAVSRLFLQEDVLGLIFWGVSEEERALTIEDYELLEQIVSIFNLSMSRSLLYEQIEDFNTKLQDEIKAATENLERANEDLRELDKAKDDLISIASHELRTPATIVKGKLHLLKGRVEKLKTCEKYDKKIDNDIEVCLSAIEREIEQVNTLLEASRIGKDTMVLDRQLFDVSEIAENAVDDFVEIAREKGLDLSFSETIKDFPFVSIDVRRIREVIDNLITNAIKYTDEGSIQVRVFQKNARNVCVSVIDTGIGIPKNKEDRLFTKFYRVRNDNGNHSQLVKPGGTGLGLFVAKNIVEKHGGKIGFESEDGKGSTFTFCLPVSRKK